LREVERIWVGGWLRMCARIVDLQPFAIFDRNQASIGDLCMGCRPPIGDARSNGNCQHATFQGAFS
jgi:hypothetical protein